MAQEAGQEKGRGADKLSPNGRAALWFAERGLYVFPCHWIDDGKCSCRKPDCDRAGKHPCCRNGLTDATTDATQIRRWWRRDPPANVAIDCGRSGIAAIDVDPRHAGDHTFAALVAGLAEPLPDTVRTLTPSGGFHLLFRSPGNIASGNGKLGTGVDVKSTGGYILLPPSNHLLGVYRFEVGYGPQDLEFAPMPEALVALTRAGAQNGNGTGHAPGLNTADILNGVEEGRRDEVLFKLVCKFRGAGIPVDIAEKLILEAASKCTPVFSPKTVVEKVQRVYKTYAGPAESPGDSPSTKQWRTPDDIAPRLLPVPPCTRDMIPLAFRPWLADAAERMQCPLDFPAVGALVTASAIVGRQIAIRPKRHDDWEVVPNIWGAVVGPPSTLKSPALLEVMGPVNDLRRKARQDHADAKSQFEFQKMVNKARRDEILKALHGGAKGGKQPTPEEMDKLRRQFQGSEQAEPVERRYITNDTTVEKLGELLNENPRGILVYRDELTGFLKALERAGHEQDRSFYLEGWNGNGMFSYDRIGRGTLHIDAVCLSILGGIQPDPLRSYLLQTFADTDGRNDGHNDGFIQRFQMLVYPDIAGKWENIDRLPDVAARQRAKEIFDKLDRLDLSSLAAIYSGRVAYVRFTDEAQEFFYEWLAGLEKRIRNPDEAPVLIEHLAKYRSLMPSLALLFWLIEGDMPSTIPTDGRVVSLAAAALALAWCDYLEAHARRIFQTITMRQRAVAAALAKKLRDGKLPNPFTARQVYNAGWLDLSNPEDVMRALELLEDAGWIELYETKNPTGGRPKVMAYINPMLLKVSP